MEFLIAENLSTHKVCVVSLSKKFVSIYSASACVCVYECLSEVAVAVAVFLSYELICC